MGRKTILNRGNDTIHPYPLFCTDVKKILIVRSDIFEELRKRYKAFCQSLRGRPAKRSSNVESTKQQVVKHKASLLENRHFRAYEPSNAIAVNECDYRRWCRAKEWFYQFSQQAINFEKNYINQGISNLAD